jgi:phosphoribosylglycinamide formyltransferase-1
VTYRVAVAVSGRGSNFVALAEALQREPVAVITLLLADRPAAALDEARSRDIPAVQLADFCDADEWMQRLSESGADLLVLAGYLRLVPAAVVEAYRGRIINVHPALLPKFGGAGMHGRRVHEAVLEAGDTTSGATVHLVDEVYDRGTVLGRGTVAIPAGTSADALAALVLGVEHRLLPAAVIAAAHAGHPVPFVFV